MSLYKCFNYVVLIFTLSFSALSFGQPYEIFGELYNEGASIGAGDINLVFQLVPTSTTTSKNTWFIKKAQWGGDLTNHEKDRFGSFLSYALGFGPETFFHFRQNKRDFFIQAKAPGKIISLSEFGLNKNIRIAFLDLMKNIVFSGVNFDDTKFDNMHYDESGKRFWLFDTGAIINTFAKILFIENSVFFPLPERSMEWVEELYLEIDNIYRKAGISAKFAEEVRETNFPSKEERGLYYNSDSFRYLFLNEALMIAELILADLPDSDKGAPLFQILLKNKERIKPILEQISPTTLEAQVLLKVKNIERARMRLFKFNKLAPPGVLP